MEKNSEWNTVSTVYVNWKSNTHKDIPQSIIGMNFNLVGHDQQLKNELEQNWKHRRALNIHYEHYFKKLFFWHKNIEVCMWGQVCVLVYPLGHDAKSIFD